MQTTVSIAAASAPVDTDLLRDSEIRSRPNTRRLKKSGFTGSAAAGDTKVELKAGSNTLAILYNTNTGYPKADADMMEINELVPANVELHAIVRDAPATNPINLSIVEG